MRTELHWNLHIGISLTGSIEVRISASRKTQRNRDRGSCITPRTQLTCANFAASVVARRSEEADKAAARDGAVVLKLRFPSIALGGLNTR